VVDAAVYARTAGEIRRSFSVAELPRLAKAGAKEGSIAAILHFAEYDGQPVIDGGLEGAAVLACQRCMQPMTIALQESFRVMVVPQERADEPGGYEPVVADVAHFDVRWFVEEQALLALPLVPMHESMACRPSDETDSAGTDEGGRQTPFADLRKMLRDR
jgi:uncharacterized protein